MPEARNTAYSFFGGKDH